MTGRQKATRRLGHSVLEWTAANDQARNAAEVSRCLAQGFVRNVEIDYVTPSGSIIPVEINATALSTESGPQILAVCRDISRAQAGRRPDLRAPRRSTVR